MLLLHYCTEPGLRLGGLWRECRLEGKVFKMKGFSPGSYFAVIGAWFRAVGDPAENRRPPPHPRPPPTSRTPQFLLFSGCGPETTTLFRLLSSWLQSSCLMPEFNDCPECPCTQTLCNPMYFDFGPEVSVHTGTHFRP